nr:gamma-glutamyl-gamma-aminobutyrate hydrolase family protein [Sulfobacillus harzensis]
MIGISMSRDYQYQNTARDFVRATYLDAVRRAGGIPVPLANVEESLAIFPLLSGLLLTGGGDFDPGLFGEPDRGTDWSGVSRERDQSELAFIEEANRREMPIFGICRGAQALAIGFGGSLIQDLPSARPDPGLLSHSQKAERVEVTHQVSTVPGSRLHALTKETEFHVNSFHHQAVDRVPTDFVVAATAPDGVIEAIEKPGHRFLLGVQWHPEDLESQYDTAARLFRGFVEACQAYLARRETNV